MSACGARARAVWRCPERALDRRVHGRKAIVVDRRALQGLKVEVWVAADEQFKFLPAEELERGPTAHGGEPGIERLELSRDRRVQHVLRVLVDVLAAVVVGHLDLRAVRDELDDLALAVDLVRDGKGEAQLAHVAGVLEHLLQPVRQRLRVREAAQAGHVARLDRMRARARGADGGALARWIARAPIAHTQPCGLLRTGNARARSAKPHGRRVSFL